jgi:flagella basal body P-ring formation protein FlgA
MSIEELAQLADEIIRRDMAKAHVIERDNSKAPWRVTANGWDWMVMLMRLAGVDMKDAKFVQVLEQARNVHTAVKH